MGENGPSLQAGFEALRDRTVHDETFLTSIAEIEFIVNGRPLTHISMDPRDLEPLTPNNILLGRACPNVPRDIITDAHVTSRKKWRQSQAIIDAFWGRLRKEYIPTLIQRQK